MTFQFTIATLLWLVATLAITVGVGLSVVFFLYRARVGGLRDQIRTAGYVLDYDSALEWAGVGMRERQALLDEVRVNIADASAEGGVRAALDRIGPARELARSVAIGRRLPKWPRGFAWGIVAAGIVQVVVLAATDAFYVAAEAAGVDSISAASGILPGVVFDYGQDGFGAEFGPASWWTWALPLLTFLITSRSWRVFATRAARTAAEL